MFTITDKNTRYIGHANGYTVKACIHFVKVFKEEDVDKQRGIWLRHRCIYIRHEKWASTIPDTRFYYSARSKRWSDSRQADSQCAIRNECKGYAMPEIKAMLNRWLLNGAVVDNALDACFEE